MIINHEGSLLDAVLTPANTDDRKPLWGMPRNTEFHGSLYADRGYILKDLREKLGEQGINLVYKVRKNMAPLEVSVCDEVLLKKRTLIESVIKELKTQTQLEHSRHRSFINFQVDVVVPMLNSIRMMLEKNANLHQTRDLLLPKLISGEIDVSELDIDTNGMQPTKGGTHIPYPLTARLHTDEKILGGKPVIRGTRLSVAFILDLLKHGWSEKEVVENYPS